MQASIQELRQIAFDTDPDSLSNTKRPSYSKDFKKLGFMVPYRIILFSFSHASHNSIFKQYFHISHNSIYKHGLNFSHNSICKRGFHFPRIQFVSMVSIFTRIQFGLYSFSMFPKIHFVNVFLVSKILSFEYSTVET